MKTFGVNSEPSCFDTGQGTTFRCGDVVLKPTDNIEEAEWIAELFDSLEDQKTFRFPRPVKSLEGEWIVDGWIAWSYVRGNVTLSNNLKEQFEICDDFHRMLRDVPKPDFIDKRDDPWSIADRVAWQEVLPKYDQAFMDYIDQILPLLKPIEVSNQLIHGDFLGNVLFEPGSLPTVIDFSFYWRPVGFAKAVMIVDALAYGNADKTVFKFLENNKDSRQLILRALLRRIVEQVEHVKQSRTEKTKALSEIKQLQKVLDLL